MYMTEKCKIGILLIAMVLTCGTADAQRRYRHYNYHRYHYSPNRYVTFVTQPIVTSHVSNHFNQKERFAMVAAYLETHDYLTIKQYANMTKLSKASAEAELDAFAMDKKSIRLVFRGKKKVYIKGNN